VPDFTDVANTLRTALNGFAPTSPLPNLPKFWPNGEAVPTLDVAPNGFIYSEVVTQSSTQTALGTQGTREFRDRGEFVIWVNVPRGTRAGTAESIAQQLRALFQPPEFSGVFIEDRTIGTPRESGAVNGPNGRLWSIPVVIDWYADRTE
jgi:hypothetical protein